MKKIFICSKFRGNVEANRKVAQEYAKSVVARGDIPLAPHLYYTYFLDDSIEIERNLGISLGLKWLEESDEVWVVSPVDDCSLSSGMILEIIEAKKMNKDIRYLGGITEIAANMIIGHELNPGKDAGERFNKEGRI